MLKISALAKRIFGSENDRRLKPLWAVVERVNALEPEMKALSDAELAAKTPAFRARLENGETLDDLAPEAFAAVREASVRTLGMRHFDVQILGGMVLHNGNIAEMKTGEGKTLVATLPVYLNALAGGGVHVVTVNDYLARRDAAWMGAIYEFLGLKVGVVVPGVDDAARRDAYDADVTYATNNELGFDYLRDNMKFQIEAMTQKNRRAFAIVDEVDSILIDEARTPLIISGPAETQSDLYTTIDKLIPKLVDEHFELDEKQRTVVLTEEGTEEVEVMLRDAGFLTGEATMYDPENISLVHHTNQALRAHKLFVRDKDYIVRNGQVIIIDEFTGRMMEGRRYSDGLHQAIEAKEKVEIKPENMTMASVTFQNYFRLYGKLAGMTGTAMTEASEFAEIYGLEVMEIPTNQEIAREDEDDQVFRTIDEKNDAVIEAIKDGVKRGQPILVGTTSIEKSEELAAVLKKARVEHEVLNARHHEREAFIIAQAGRPGAVTIATNMAGRGTDIKLGGNVEMRVAERLAELGVTEPDEKTLDKIKREVDEEVESAKRKALEAGGLWVISTERHESRRIDNQLRGRSGRQGDPGRSTFFLSLQDDLMRIFGSQRMDKMLTRLGLQEGEAIVHPWVNKAIERSQAKVEARNFEIRKNLLKFDNVMNDQRRAIFDQRLEIIQSPDVAEIVRDMRHEVVDELVRRHVPEHAYADQWETDALQEEVTRIFGAELPVKAWAEEEGVDEEVLIERLTAEVDKLAAQKVAEFSPEVMRDVEKAVLLQTIDTRWRDHLGTLDHLRAAIGLRGFAQRDPLNEYKSEAFQLFESLLARLRTDTVRQLMNVRLQRRDPAQAPGSLAATDVQVSVNAGAGAAEPTPAREPADAMAAASVPGAPGASAAHHRPALTREDVRDEPPAADAP